MQGPLNIKNCYHCLILGFCHKVEENCAFLCYCAAHCGKSYHYSRRNNPDEHSSVIVVGSGLGALAKVLLE